MSESMGDYYGLFDYGFGHRKIADTLTLQDYFYLMLISKSIFIFFNMILTLKHKIQNILIINFVSIYIGWILLRLSKEFFPSNSYTIIMGSLLISFGHSSFIALIIGLMEGRTKLNITQLGILNFSNFYLGSFYIYAVPYIGNLKKDLPTINLILITISFIFYCALIFLERKRLMYASRSDI